MPQQMSLPHLGTPSLTRRENINRFLRGVMLDVADKSSEPTAQAIRSGVEPTTALCAFLRETGNAELAEIVNRIIEEGS